MTLFRLITLSGLFVAIGVGATAAQTRRLPAPPGLGVRPGPGAGAPGLGIRRGPGVGAPATAEDAPGIGKRPGLGAGAPGAGLTVRGPAGLVK